MEILIKAECNLDTLILELPEILQHARDFRRDEEATLFGPHYVESYEGVRYEVTMIKWESGECVRSLDLTQRRGLDRGYGQICRRD